MTFVHFLLLIHVTLKFEIIKEFRFRMERSWKRWSTRFRHYLKELGKITSCENASERWPNQKKEEQVSIFNKQ